MLNPASPGIGSGTNVAAVMSVVSRDYAGNQRLSSIPYDIGAFNYAETIVNSDTTVPTAPTGLNAR